MQKRKQPRKRRTGRKLLAFVVALGILAFGWVHIVHGSSGTKKKHHTASCTAAVHARTCVNGARGARGIAAGRPALPAYARHLTPVLGRARSAFDGAAAAVQETDLNTLDGICGTYGSEIAVLADEADGVPHPGPWYQPVSQFHHTLMGLFHDMEGALQICQTAAENGDDGTVAVARDDIATAAQQMRSTDDYVVSLSHHR